ncbi:uncharacterized protein BX664DRAFT_362915 [Halteromyces radiatus]|uniref:uncharacterized protein n=1 Tax=Halteromyces radiatus TaxID=101107 RepID=UPI0022208E12|nr:uncharacterized protein BX664DRAFT_353995 [Halteromyces radiatus]XP_051395644.1 uncharacterized protein BX664DRAFT_362915 [Halteromyces radiatus]KAI8075966.1 hypothetical protein BX664DRAFT_353995 [Halteromyces radiatus]KAI8075985.1 hypothetical protein BX664DRAFT_362915 [Halteromyces radiatus]
MLAMVKGSRGDLKRLFYVLNLVVTSFCFIHVADGKEIYDDLKWCLPPFVLFMLTMAKRSYADLKRLVYVLNLVVTSFCFIHVGDVNGIYDDLKQLFYVLKVVFISLCFIHVGHVKEISW